MRCEEKGEAKRKKMEVGREQKGEQTGKREAPGMD